MMKFKFVYLVFQKGKFSERVETVQEFANPTELAITMAKFAAEESIMRLDPRVRQCYHHGKPKLIEPHLNDGYGPETCLVIESVTPL